MEVYAWTCSYVFVSMPVRWGGRDPVRVCEFGLFAIFLSVWMDVWMVEVCMDGGCIRGWMKCGMVVCVWIR